MATVEDKDQTVPHHSSNNSNNSNTEFGPITNQNHHHHTGSEFTTPTEIQSQPPVQTSSSTPSTSRSGRVRKKNSFLADFESLEDHYEKPKKSKFDKLPKITSRKTEPSSPKFIKKEPEKFQPPPSPDIAPLPTMTMNEPQPHLQIVGNDEEQEGTVSELDMDSTLFNEADMPMLAAEEIIDESLLESEEAIEIPLTNSSSSSSLNSFPSLNNIRSSNNNSNGNSKLKSQAQSTYMLEKPKPPGTKSKSGGAKSNSYSITNTIPVNYPARIPKKKSSLNATFNPPEKQGRRITAYQLWTKEQRTNFTERFPHLDTSQFSKKLGELWGEVPQAQKKMWKNRAAKMMKSGENMKNTLPPKKSRAKSNPNSKKGIKTPKIKNSSPTGRIIQGGGKSRKKLHKNPIIDDGIAPPPKKLESIMDGLNLGIGSQGTSGGSAGKGKGRGGSKKTEVFKNGGRNAHLHNPGVSNHVGVGGSQTRIVKKEEEHVFKVTDTNPIDLASHFSLLGESLSVIGQRLKEHEGQNVSGSLSVLLDSLLCATGPLLCLTQQVEELNVIPEATLRNTLDNIAYIMPASELR